MKVETEVVREYKLGKSQDLNSCRNPGAKPEKQSNVIGRLPLGRRRTGDAGARSLLPARQQIAQAEEGDKSLVGNIRPTCTEIPPDCTRLATFFNRRQLRCTRRMVN